MNNIDNMDLWVLNCWKDGTVGWHNEQGLINMLNLLCKEYGYGRVPQLCKHIEDIWRDSARIEYYAEQRRLRLEMLENDKINL